MILPKKFQKKKNKANISKSNPTYFVFILNNNIEKNIYIKCINVYFKQIK